MSTPIHQVDAFAEAPFQGNPAAVCILGGPAPERWMQAVALEMNLSETAFLHPEGAGWRLRWFTPAVEVDLCGHATLASAHVLWESGQAIDGAPLVFHTRAGALGARRTGERIVLDFPSKRIEDRPPPAGLIEALCVREIATGKNQLDWLVEVGSEAEVRSCAPDLARLRRVDARGVIVTARATDPRFDFVSRFFAPAVGVDEDPVTGSAHCALAPYWSRKLGKRALTAFQASRRGGTLWLEVAGERVKIAGHAITTLRGHLLSDPS